MIIIPELSYHRLDFNLKNTIPLTSYMSETTECKLDWNTAFWYKPL